MEMCLQKIPPFLFCLLLSIVGFVLTLVVGLFTNGLVFDGNTHSGVAGFLNYKPSDLAFIIIVIGLVTGCGAVYTVVFMIERFRIIVASNVVLLQTSFACLYHISLLSKL